MRGAYPSTRCERTSSTPSARPAHAPCASSRRCLHAPTGGSSPMTRANPPSAPADLTTAVAAVVAAPARAGRDLIRCGAELVELAERFYRGMFVGCVAFVGMAGIAALALLPLRRSDASYATVTVALTAILVAATPVAVWRADLLYRLLRRRHAAHGVVVLLAAALVVY